MPRYTAKPRIGDVLVTREGPWYVSWPIRIGAAMLGLPAKCNHVIIVHHQDASGVWWGIEGRPGGVGWKDLTEVSRHAVTNANSLQPKTDGQRYLIATAAEQLLGTEYDWAGIAKDARDALHLIWSPSFLREWQDGEVPAQVVCSSFADWCYEQVGLANPGGLEQTRGTTPGHWDRFMINREWEYTK